MRVASIGECMVELREAPDGSLKRAFGGDTLNTAIYLARLGIPVDYVTALGDDEWSIEMLAAWQAEGVGTRHVHQIPGKLPGLYVIQTDAKGERRFLHWRDSAAARHLLAHLHPEALGGSDVIYVSGISLSIYPEAARDILFRRLDAAKANGARIAFDTNFRPRGWPDKELAARLYERTFALADLILASSQDLTLLFGTEGPKVLSTYATNREVVLKLDHPAVLLFHDGSSSEIGAEPVGDVVDTTAAGDSFAAAYLASRLRGRSPEAAAQAGHDLAGIVIRHPGAIIPAPAMAHLMHGSTV